MTRINTNVSSLVAQKSLARSNASLQQALTRLSTGLRINVGKDDPAGLIASEMLRSDITSVRVAITNSQRANQMIATADSALGQVSSLLNDIRGLVTEAANEGAMSEDQIAANQLQVDSSLDALNRIAQTTSFQGRRILDGTLDFVTTAGAVGTIEDIQITQANLGSAGQIAVDVDIANAATQAKISGTGFSAAADAQSTLEFAAGAQLVGDTTAAAKIDIFAVDLSTTLEGTTILMDGETKDTGATGAWASYDAPTTKLTISIDKTKGATAQQVEDAVNLLDDFQAVDVGATAWVGGDALGDGGSTAAMGIAELKIEADTPGADFNNMAISIATADILIGAPTADYDPTQNEMLITVSDGTSDSGLTTLASIKGVIEAITTADFTVTVTTAGQERLTIYGAGVDVQETGNTDTTGGNVLLGDLVAEIRGTDGTEVFSFQTGASVNQIAAAVSVVSDATGVAASQSAGVLSLLSTAYGTRSLVAIEVISEGALGTFGTGLSSTRQTGTDIDATINGVAANGDGNEFSINTSSLDMSITVTAGSSTNFDFNITGGGALFQLGPDVVSNQQARLGISSVNSSTLRGTSGRLYQLGSGESAALETDATLAGQIVDQVLNKITSLRGRLGALQKTTLEVNINSLSDTLENLSEAESSIRDADFALETAALTRAQILVQSGMSVLAIANANPQNVLALLR